MLRRVFLSCVFVLSAAAVVGAQPGSAGVAGARKFLPASEPDAQKLVADRHRFVEQVYDPAPETSARILDALKELADAQRDYRAKVNLTLERLRLVIDIIANDENLTDDQRAARHQKFQGQYYRILARAPLSLRNVVRLAEVTLPSDAVSAGRARMQSVFATEIKAMSMPFDVENIDGIAFGPIQPGDKPEIQLPSRQVAEKPPAAPSTPAQTPTPESAQSSAAAPRRTPVDVPTPPKADLRKERADALAKAPSAPPPPVAPPRTDAAPAGKPAAPAPPISEWRSRTLQLAEKFDFSEGQKVSAESILEQCTKQAEAYRSENESAYQGASALPAGEEKTKRLADLDAPINSLYDQMVQRISALASLEQRNRAAARDRAAQAVESSAAEN